jgi:hypothetical protein
LFPNIPTNKVDNHFHKSIISFPERLSWVWVDSPKIVVGVGGFPKKSSWVWMDFPKNRRGWWVDSLKIIVVCLPNPSEFFFVCFDLSLIPPTTKKQSLSLIKIVVVWVLNHKDFSIENMEDPDFGFSLF